MKKRDLTCFKAYDVRGELGVNFDSGLCFDIGRAFADVFDAKNIVVGFDARTSSPELSKNIIEGILTQGSNVFYIGMSGTEEVYWATTFFKACGGIQVTASHNPINFNGLKFVKAGSKPLEPKNEMQELKNRNTYLLRVLKPLRALPRRQPSPSYNTLRQRPPSPQTPV